jgi:hypothetical protein
MLYKKKKNKKKKFTKEGLTHRIKGIYSDKIILQFSKAIINEYDRNSKKEKSL